MNGSLADACRWTLVRTDILCLLAWPLIVAIERYMRGLSDARRPVALAALLVPFLFPELLVGYVYRNIALAFPQRAELLCASLLFLRIVPVGVVTLLVSPATIVSPSAIRCRWMLLRTNPCSLSQWWQLIRCYLNGPVRRALPALGLMAIVAFQEFELAALLQTASWTDWFIAAQRVGLERNEMIRQTLRPVLVQLPFLAGAFLWFARSEEPFAEQNEVIPAASRASKFAVTLYLGCALLFGGLIPLWMIARNSPAGLVLLTRQAAQWSGLGREILIAATISLLAGTAAWLLANAWMLRRQSTVISVLFHYALLIPGLIGSLLLSLSTVVAFQQPSMRPFYDTPIPWALALLVWLFPRAVLLRLWLGKITRTESVSLAEMLADQPLQLDNGRTPAVQSGDSSSGRRSRQTRRGRVLLFRLRDQPQLLAAGLLAYWAYLDLSTAYLLAPSGLSSGLVRLYNFMHFGRSAALSAEACLFFAAPLVTVVFAIQLLRMVSWIRTDFN